MSKYIRYIIAAIAFLSLLSCNQFREKKDFYEWNNGKVVITADSNLRFVLEPLVPIYENFYPGATVSFQYTSEDAAITDFLDNKKTIIAVARQLSEAEQQKAAATQDAKIIESIFAYDAIAVIANKSFKDSVFTIENTAAFLTPESPIKLVFDNSKSGIVRTILQLSQAIPDSFKNAYALNSIDEVLKYVESNKNTIGFIPYNLLSNRNEATAKKIRASFKFLSVKYKNETTLLSQENIAEHSYPLIRPLAVYIGNCPDLVGQGFTNFLFSRQISKALILGGLVPQKIPDRDVVVTDEFKPSSK